MSANIPVIAIDGPTASGKGTVASLVAQALGFHYLDSGAIYRVLALDTLFQRLDPDKTAELELIAERAAGIDVTFVGDVVLLQGNDVSSHIRTEEVGNMASRLAAVPKLREFLLQRQRDFRCSPGLVADGRDMGSVVFPDAYPKVFLTASAEVRAKRRYKQILDRGLKADYDAIFADLQARDARDTQRSVAPLKPCDGALVLDCSNQGIEEVVDQILAWYR